MRMRRWVGLSVVIALSTVVATVVTPVSGTAGAAGGPQVTLTVEYWSGFNPGGIDIVPAWINAAAAVLHRSHPNVKVVTDEITTGSEAEYYTKVDLGERSAATSADVVLEDSFLIGSDATAGYLRPLPALKSWPGWSDYYPAMQSLASYQGKVYGAMNSTDVQLIYFNKKILKKAGLPPTWQPHNWADVLSAAKAIKAHVPGIIPLWVYTGQAMGEASSFRGFEIFLAGTNDRLYDYTTGKWEIGGPGFNATWNLLAAMRPYEEDESYWSSPNADATVDLTLIPNQQVGLVFDGSWVATAFVPGGLKPWPAFFSTYGTAAIPTAAGQAPGYTNQSGGWALSVPRYAPHPSLSTELIEDASSAPLLASFDPASGNLPPRKAVLTQPAWLASSRVNPVQSFAAAQLPATTYRPGLPAYVQVSNVIAQLTGEISSGSLTPRQAAAAYASQVTQIVGANNVERVTR